MASPRLVLALPTVLLLSSFTSAVPGVYDDPGFISAGSAGSAGSDGPKSTSAVRWVFDDPGFISAGPKPTSEDPEGGDDCDRDYWARHLSFDVSLAEFLERRETRSPACVDWVPESDGCSHAPDKMWGASFTKACIRHDFGYKNFGSMCIFDHDLRKKVDKAFEDDLEDICEELSFFKRILCKGTAKVYYAAVRAGGRVFGTDHCGTKKEEASR